MHRLGAEISITKKKWMYVSSDSVDERELPEVFIREEKVERVHEFLYLGSIVGDTYSLGILGTTNCRSHEDTRTIETDLAFSQVAAEH